MVDLVLEAHIGLERQGPGSPEVVEQALGFLKPLNQFSQIADLGCGAGDRLCCWHNTYLGQLPVWICSLIL